MNKQDFNYKTKTDISDKQFATVNSVQTLRVKLRIKWLPDVITIFTKGGIALIESTELKLLAILKHRETISHTSKQIIQHLHSMHRELKEKS